MLHPAPGFEAKMLQHQLGQSLLRTLRRNASLQKRTVHSSLVFRGAKDLMAFFQLVLSRQEGHVLEFDQQETTWHL